MESRRWKRNERRREKCYVHTYNGRCRRLRAQAHSRTFFHSARSSVRESCFPSPTLLFFGGWWYFRECCFPPSSSSSSAEATEARERAKVPLPANYGRRIDIRKIFFLSPSGAEILGSEGISPGEGKEDARLEKSNGISPRCYGTPPMTEHKSN